jgi:hypothetical protein
VQKAPTLVTLVVVCTAAISVAYYYGRYLPRLKDMELAEQRRKTDLENAQRCNTDALKFYSAYRKEMFKEVSSSGWHDPEMHFSKRLNTCLVEIGWDNFIGGDLHRTRSVTDVYSNREIISVFYLFKDGEPKSVLPFSNSGYIDPKKYQAEKDKLFSE